MVADEHRPLGAGPFDEPGVHAAVRVEGAPRGVAAVHVRPGVARDSSARPAPGHATRRPSAAARPTPRRRRATETGGRQTRRPPHRPTRTRRTRRTDPGSRPPPRRPDRSRPHGQPGDDLGKLLDHPPAAQLRGVVRDRLEPKHAFALSVLGTPVKVGIRCCLPLFGLVPAHVPGGGGPQSGSRWSAHSAARTNDLEADEDPPQTWPAGGEAKTLRFKSSAASWERRTCCGRQRRTCRRPALSGSTDEVRRHDDGWGARRAGCRRGAVAQSLREVHPTTRRWRQANCGSWPQASADLWAGHVRNASQAATSCGRISGSARAASPSSRSV